MRPSQTDDAGALVEFEASAHTDVLLPADAHVIGEPITVMQIRCSGFSRVRTLLVATHAGDVEVPLRVP